MTPEEIKEFVLANMTAEEALDKFIKTSVEHYEYLKTDPQYEGNPFFIMITAAAEIGWDVALENHSPNEEVRGAIFGTEEYIESILARKQA